MSSWNKKIIIFSYTLLFSIFGATALAIEDALVDTPKMNSQGGVDIPIGKVPVQKNENSVGLDIVSDNIQYFPDEKKIVATGHAYVKPKGKDTKLKADKITMYQELNEILAEGNVKVVRQDIAMYGDFIRIDLKKESILMKSPKTEVGNIRLVAKEGYVYAEDIEAVKGTANITEEMHFVLGSSAFSTGFESEEAKRIKAYTNSDEYKKKIKNKAYKIKTKEIELVSGDERHFIKMKNASIYKGKFKLATAPSIVMSTDRHFSEVETMLPEIGQTDQSGMYFGPAALFNLPFATSLKVAPLVMQDDGNWGYGGFARIRNSKNKTEFMYGNVTSNAILKGQQELWDPRFNLRYSKNAYIDDGFMGEKLPGYLVDVQFNDVVQLDDLGLVYYPIFSAGVASDNADDPRFDDGQMHHGKGWSTARFKAQGRITQKEPFWNYKDLLKLSLIGEYDFTQYGSALKEQIGNAVLKHDTNTATVRFGPTLRYSGKDLMARVGYRISGSHGKSPFKWDSYYYGKQTLMFGTEYKFNDRISFGYSNVIALQKNTYDQDALAENKFYTKIGPEDFKFCFAYDTVRRRTMMGLNLLVGSDKSDIEFDKFKIKEYKKLEKDKKEENL